MPQTIGINMQAAIDDKILEAILSAAIEGGSNYWAYFQHVKRDAEGNYISADFYDEEDNVFKGKVTLSAVATGLQRIINWTPEQHKAKYCGEDTRREAIAIVFMPDNADWDAGTADAIIQAALFDEIVYG